MATENVLYNGDVELIFYEKEHLYSVDGVVVPSVTKIIGVMDKPALIYWAVNETLDALKRMWKPGRAYNKLQIANILSDAKGARFRTSKKALNIGSEAHDWIERYIKAQMLFTAAPEMPEYPPVLASVKSYTDWEKDRQYIKYLYSERKLYSKEFMYSGMVDIVMVVNGEIIVADLKTSKGIYDDYFVQCAAYAKALEEELGIEVSKIMVIRIPKDGNELEFQVADNIDELFDVFKACLAIWRWKNDWSPASELWTLE